MKNAILLLLIAGLVAALGWATLIWEPSANGEHRQVDAAGTPVGGDFTLRSADGPFSLSALEGDVVLLYFGYTWCPDICPTSLAMMSQAFGGLKPDELARVHGIFISIDPERDSVRRLEEYTRHFHPRIKGVTGSVEEVTNVARQYGAAYRKAGDGASGDSYSVDHSSYTYLVDLDGKLQNVLPHGTPPGEIRRAVRRLLGE